MRRLNEAIMVSEGADVKLTKAAIEERYRCSPNLFIRPTVRKTKVTFPSDYPFLASIGLC